MRCAGPPGSGERWYARYAALLGPVLGAYLLADRGVAHLHLPGTPLYLGEMLLGVGLVGAILATGYFRQAIAADPLLMLLTGFMAWGLLRALPQARTYGLNTARDSALWYYGLFAVLLVAACAVRRDLLHRLGRQFSRFIPLLLVWLPFALAFGKILPVHVRFPGSDVPALAHKPGNIAVAAALALVFLWVVPDDRRSGRSRNWLSALALVTVGATATQNRGGGVAAMAAVIVALCFLPNRLRLLGRAAAVVAVVVGLAGLAGLGVTSAQSGRRSVSVTQLLQNLKSIEGGHATGNLQATVTFREQLLARVLVKEVRQGKLAQGFGFGPNMALVAGISPSAAINPSLELRSPHDSTFDVLARMGVIGLGLWLTLWAAWLARMVRSRRRLADPDDRWRRGAIEWCLAAAVAILVNSFFDPTLEGAQVALLLWTIFGVGVVLTNPRLWSWMLQGPPRLSDG